MLTGIKNVPIFGLQSFGYKVWLLVYFLRFFWRFAILKVQRPWKWIIKPKKLPKTSEISTGKNHPTHMMKSGKRWSPYCRYVDYGGSKNTFFEKCKVLMSQKSQKSPKHCIRSLSSICEVYRWAPSRWSFGNTTYRGPKNKVFNFLSFWGQEVSPGWEHSKSGLKIIIIQYLTPLRPKNSRNLTNLAILPATDHFRQFFGRKWGQMVSNFNFKTRFGILSSWQNFWPQNERKLKTLFFFGPL